MSGNYYESSDDACEDMRLRGGIIMVSSISGRIAADVGVERFWLNEVGGHGSPHDGEWYWYGPFEQLARDGFHPLVDPPGGPS